MPGSHLRRVRSSGLDRYQHIVGEQQFSGPAGTVVVFHHGLWHAGQPNPGDGDRWMHKVRLNPTVPQVRLWNTDDLAGTAEPTVGSRLRSDAPRQRGADPADDAAVDEHHRLPQRAGPTLEALALPDRRRQSYDVDHYLTRLEGRSALVGS